MRACFIVNPAAGGGAGRRRWKALESAALRAVPGGEVRWTGRPGDAAALARRAALDGFDAVIAVGGDGTLGEAADGLMSLPAAERAALGCWPLGSGNDFARHLGLGGGAERLAAWLSRPVARDLDCGVVEFAGAGGPARRHFLNVVSLGLGGDVARRVEAHGKPLGGTLSYLAASLAALASAGPWPLELRVDGGPPVRDSFFLVAVANTSTTGGGMRIAPTADCEDGLFDVLLVAAQPRWRLLRRLPSLYTGGHLGAPGVALRRARRLELSSPEPVFLNIDGEAAGLLPARFELLPRALRVLCAT